MIAVVIYGLYGSANAKWGMSSAVTESTVFDTFWDTISFMLNGIVFFYAGASSVNFFWRSSEVRTPPLCPAVKLSQVCPDQFTDSELMHSREQPFFSAFATLRFKSGSSGGHSICIFVWHGRSFSGPIKPIKTLHRNACSDAHLKICSQGHLQS